MYRGRTATSLTSVLSMEMNSLEFVSLSKQAVSTEEKLQFAVAVTTRGIEQLRKSISEHYILKE